MVERFAARPCWALSVDRFTRPERDEFFYDRDNQREARTWQ